MTSWMRSFAAAAITWVFAGQALAGIGGDLGGGGQAQKADPFVLTVQERTQLLKQPDAQAAFELWIKQMDDKKQYEVFVRVFEAKILPQLQPPQGKK